MEAQNEVSNFSFDNNDFIYLSSLLKYLTFFLVDQFCCLLHLIFQDGLKPKDTKIVQDYFELKYGHFRDAKKFSQEIDKTPNKIFDRRNQIQQFLLKGLLFFFFLFFFFFSFFLFLLNTYKPNQFIQEIQCSQNSQSSHFQISILRFVDILLFYSFFFSFCFSFLISQKSLLTQFCTTE